MVDDIECVEDCLHSPVRAPQGNAQPDESRKPKAAGGLLCQALELLTNDLQPTFGEHAGQGIDMLRYRTRICVQAIKRYQAGDTREDGKKHVERDPCCDGEEA